jgi:hypothetical protein
LPLCNADGIALQHRGNETTAERFKYWGTWTGGVWSEGVEGTSGSAVLLAVDNDQYIVGGDRLARSALALDDQSVGNGVHLRTLFDYDGSVFRRRGDPEDFAAHLMGGHLARRRERRRKRDSVQCGFRGESQGDDLQAA